MGLEELNIEIGKLEKGLHNSITDIPGVTVGHVTLNKGEARTGVTAIMPSRDNIFAKKMIAASHVINGFGKSIGLMQIDELGTLESPIVLTNTLSVAKGIDGLLTYMLGENQDIGLETGTINPVVCECNDGYLNQIRQRFVKEHHVLQALKNTDVDFEQGGVGAGTGMSCYHLKGGIGSSSRKIHMKDDSYHLGVLVLTNFGKCEELIVAGKPIGKSIAEKERVLCDNMKQTQSTEDKGSVIIVLATDAPVSHRQLKRIIKRCELGLARTGSYTSNGSGEVVLGFSTHNRIDHYGQDDVQNLTCINENKIDKFFVAARDCVEEAVLNSMLHAKTTHGRNGHERRSLNTYKGLL